MPTAKQAPTTEASKVFDFEERSALFGEDVIRLVRRTLIDPVSNRIVAQLVGSGTSVGANYMEAREAESKKDFRHKVAIAKKEARESMHWLRMLAVARPELQPACRELWKEAHELTMILAAMHRGRKDESDDDA